MQTLFPGVWRITLGEPEQFTPVKLRHKQVDTERLQNMPTIASCPLVHEAFSGLETSRGYVVDIVTTSDEQFYGLGLQLKSFNQKGTKKTLRVNSDPKVDLGDSHAPVPFIVSSNGYGVLVDTARYATFYINCTQKLFPSQISSSRSTVTTSLHDLYASHRSADSESLTIEITTAKGVDIYIFGGPTMKEAIQRYNLFSGGGCLPPRWGLGIWYRCRADFDQSQVIEIADDLRRNYIPCDVIIQTGRMR